jgi:hypothetical protein
MATGPKKMPIEPSAGLSDEHRQMIAEGIATMHRFSAEPRFKHRKPEYKGGNTVAAIAHAKPKRRR